MITFSCLDCERSFSVKDELAGRKAKCPQCSARLVVPAAPLPAADPPKPAPAVSAESPPPKSPAAPVEEILWVIPMEDDVMDVVEAVTPAGENEAKPSMAGNPPVAPANADYGPVAPKVARLKANERHLYTFTIFPCSWQDMWTGKWPGWYPGMTKYLCHLTDKRILIEPYTVSTAKKWAARGLLGLLFLANPGAAGGLVADLYGPGSAMEGGLKRRRNDRGEWFTISHSKIATVDWAKHNWPDKLAIKMHGKSKVMLAFKKQGVKPLVFQVFASQLPTKAFAIAKNFSNDFIGAMGQILQSR